MKKKIGWGTVIALLVYLLLLLALTALQTFLCGGGMLAGYLLGGRKRMADRKKLTGRD